MMTREWWAKNAGGLFLSGFIGIGMYAASSYITNAVTREMRGYVPLAMWNTWANERGEWRGTTDQRLKALETEMAKQREENLKAINSLAKDMAVQTTVLLDVKAAVDFHVNGLHNGPRP